MRFKPGAGFHRRAQFQVERRRIAKSCLFAIFAYPMPAGGVRFGLAGKGCGGTSTCSCRPGAAADARHRAGLTLLSDW
jgi:hypothetical protein